MPCCNSGFRWRRPSPTTALPTTTTGPYGHRLLCVCFFIRLAHPSYRVSGLHYVEHNIAPATREATANYYGNNHDIRGSNKNTDSVPSALINYHSRLLKVLPVL